MKPLVVVFIAMMLACSTWSQVTVDSTVTAQTLVEEFLLGSGVLIENVTFTGSNDQIGAFYDDGVLSMDSGIVMSTAWAINIDQSSDGFGDVPFDIGATGDQDLLDVANSVPELIGEFFSVGSVNNICAIEFDFVPYGDSLSFNFVFGSDEYLEWVNTAFNDVFAFFVSGPGIEGPYDNGAVNIAMIPDTDPAIPITVSSVNDVTNAEFYIDNVANEDINIDGYTVVIPACLNGLTIGETYHMRLAIADGSDSALESVVCLQAGSFTSYVTTDPGSPGDLDGDGDLDVQDLLLIVSDWGCTEDCIGDVDGDGLVGVGDILFFLGLF